MHIKSQRISKLGQGRTTFRAAVEYRARATTTCVAMRPTRVSRTSLMLQSSAIMLLFLTWGPSASCRRSRHVLRQPAATRGQARANHVSRARETGLHKHCSFVMCVCLCVCALLQLLSALFCSLAFTDRLS
eukprot:1970697-Pleurochrysis_carterae.AAC.1